jgi:IS30 family transposase
MKNMAEGITIAEMVLVLKRKPDTIKRQLQRKGIKPKEYAGPTALYNKSVLEAIRDIAPVGRPKKQPEAKPAKVKKALGKAR